MRIQRDHLVSTTPVKPTLSTPLKPPPSVLLFDSNIWLFRLEGIKDSAQRFLDIQILVPMVVLDELSYISRNHTSSKAALAASSLAWLADPSGHLPGHSPYKINSFNAKSDISQRIRLVTSSGDVVPGGPVCASRSTFVYNEITNNDDILIRVCLNTSEEVLLVTEDLNLINKSRIFKIPAMTWRDYSKTYLG